MNEFSKRRGKYEKIKISNEIEICNLNLGFSCNNNCTHCINKPEIMDIQKQFSEKIILDSGIERQNQMDMTYDEVIDILSNQTKEFDQVILTGGEPTLREDFFNIIQWLYYNRPNSKVILQTNGRSFANMEQVELLRRYSRDINIAITLHGLEETHNKIVNNTKGIGNPFKETVQGIKNILNVFSPKDLRTITVMTTENIRDVVDCVKFQHEELGINDNITLSYPVFFEFNPDEIDRLAPSIYRVTEIMKEINQYIINLNHELYISFANIPLCFFYKINGYILIKDYQNKKAIDAVNLLKNQNSNLNQDTKEGFIKLDICKSCLIFGSCYGIFRETKDKIEPFIFAITEITPTFLKFLKRHD